MDVQISFSISQTAVLWPREPYCSSGGRFRPCKTGLSRCARTAVFRVYAGYTGWPSEQLRNELKFSYWKLAAATESTVFDPHSETLWPRLSGQTH